MSGYTAKEIQTVVESLVLSTIRRPYDTLGVRRTDVSFTDIQQAAAGVFILQKQAAPYVLFLGTQRLTDLIEAEVVLLDQLLAAIAATDKPVLPVDDVSTLFNAQAALQELARAAAQQSVAGDVTKTPGFVRFSDNTQRFLDGPGQNVKGSGQVIQTPQEARGSIPGLVHQLEEAHALLVARVQGISAGLEDFNSVSLPSVVSASVLANAAKLVGEDADKMAALTPMERLALVRQTVLNVLAAKAVVTTFGSFSPPGDFYALNGLGVPYSDAVHLASPASAVAGSGAFGVIEGVNDGLSFTLDGETTFDLALQPSVMAQLDGFATDEQFVIDGTNNRLKMRVGSAVYTATLPSSLARIPAVLVATGLPNTAEWYGSGGLLDGTTLSLTVDGAFVYSVTLSAPADVADLVTQINAVTNLAGEQHRVAVTAPVNKLTFTSVSTGASASILVGVGTANSVLGLTAGQLVVGSSSPWTADYLAVMIAAALPPEASAEAYYFPRRYSGPLDITAGTDTVWSVPGGASDLVALGVKAGDTVQVSSGANAGIWPVLAVTATTVQVQGAFVDRLGAPVEVGPKNRAVRIMCIDPASQLPIEQTLTVFGDDDVSRAAARTLGFADGITAQCLRTTMAGLAADLGSKTQSLGVEAVDVFSLTGVPAKTDPTNPLQVSLRPSELVGDTAFFGTTLAFTVTSVVTTRETAVGDVVVLGSGTDVLKSYVVTTINGETSAKTLAPNDVIGAEGSETGFANTGITAYFGPALTLEKYQALLVESGPNSGRYTVAGPGTTPLDILLTQALPLFASGPVPLDMTVSYGTTSVRFVSKTKAVQSRLEISGDFTGTIDARGTTPWLKLPRVLQGLEPGDLLELYDGDYKTPSSVHQLLGVESALKVIKVTPELPSETSWQFTPQPPPFARLRHGAMNDYSTVKAKMDVWLSRDVNQPAFFVNLNRFINPLLANKNPTAVEVADATHEVQRLYGYLLGTQAALQGVPAEQALGKICASFFMKPVAAVDTLLRTFKEKGSDRANDLLLQGAFSTFFGLTVDGASYSGAFQEAARDVARNDLPIRKFNRPETQTSRRIAEMSSPDYEFHINDMTESAVPDIPAPFGEPAGYGRK